VTVVAVWESRKLAHAYHRIGSGTTPTSGNTDYYDDETGTPWITTSELRETYIQRTSTNVTQSALDDFTTLRTYAPNSVFMAMYGATIGRLGISTMPATCNQACCVFETSEKFENRFLYYWLWHRRAELISLSVGGGQPNLSQQDLKSEKALCPPLETQKRIAAFLDEKTAQIDALIARKQALLQRLTEKRQAIITQAVTKGLNPDAHLNDSGIDWLGQIPAHWEVKRLRFLVRLMSGATPTTGLSEYWDGNINWISPKDMKADEITDTIDKVTGLAVEDYGLKRFDEPNVVIVVRGMILARYVPVSVASGTYTINQDMKVMRSRGEVVPWYLQMYLAAIQSYLMTLIAEAGHGTKALRTDVLMDTPILLPPMQEQIAIIELIEHRKARIDGVSNKVTRFLDRLNEYRAALINAAVTGRIEGLR
jgi:type I restriction enzyme S subunit